MTIQETRKCFGTIALAVISAMPAAAQSAGPPEPGNPYDPPPCTGAVFDDVTCGGLFDAWIEQYAADQITGGCGGGNYCPNNPVTRGQMAVFVEKAMRGTSSWSPGSRDNDNTAIGGNALLHNTFASSNTAIGAGSLLTQSFDNGGTPYLSGNTAIGAATLVFNQPTSVQTGSQNTAVGAYALSLNTTGYYNTAIGADALQENLTGYTNTAVGTASLQNSTGFQNTAIGYRAGNRIDTITGYLGTDVTFVPNVTGNYNTFLGFTGATAQVDNCTAIGIDAYCVADNQVRLGNVFVSSIGGKVDWSTLSDVRAKEDVRELDQGLRLVLALRPVSYRYKAGNGRQDMGFVAQDVETVLGEDYNVVDPGTDGDRTLSLRYAQLIAPLVRAVQEQQAQIEALRAEIAVLRAEGARRN